MTRSLNKTLSGCRPDFGFPTCEPSLQDIIFSYYSKYFDKSIAEQYTNRYINSIIVKLEEDQ